MDDGEGHGHYYDRRHKSTPQTRHKNDSSNFDLTKSNNVNTNTNKKYQYDYCTTIPNFATSWCMSETPCRHLTSPSHVQHTGVGETAPPDDQNNKPPTESTQTAVQVQLYHVVVISVDIFSPIQSRSLSISRYPLSISLWKNHGCSNYPLKSYENYRK